MRTIEKFKYIFSIRERLLLLGVITLMIVSSMIEAAATYVVLPFVYVLTDPQIPQEGILSKLFVLLKCDSVDIFIFRFAIIIAIFYMVKGVYKIFVIYIQGSYLAMERCKVSTRLFSSIAYAPYKYFLKLTTPEFQRLVIDDVKRLFNYLNAFLNILSDGLTFIGMVVVMIIINPIITIIVGVVLGGMAYLTNKIVMKRVENEGRKVTLIGTEMIKWVQQFMGGLKNVLLNHRQPYFIQEYGEQSHRFAKTQSNFLVFSILPYQIIQGISMAIVFVSMALFVMNGVSVTGILPSLSTFALAIMKILPLISSISSQLSTMKFNEPGMELVYGHLLDVEVEESKEKEVVFNRDDDHQKMELEEGIFVKNVSFKFDDSSTLFFNGVSLDIPAHKSVAFVGTTGSGKTTMADIILGLQKISSGKVIADGRDIYKEHSWWGKMAGYIPQSIYLCNDTIRCNVAFGIDIDEIDDNRVWDALEQARIKDFVMKLPDGIDTITGENGVRLSGGQKQRIGIARALYQDPPFLVLDEATSALDVETEAAIMETIKNFSGRKTMLIIAHRLTTIEHCDIVYRIEDGIVSIERDRRR